MPHCNRRNQMVIHNWFHHSWSHRSIDIIGVRGWSPRGDRKLIDTWSRVNYAACIGLMFIVPAIFGSWA